MDGYRFRWLGIDLAVLLIVLSFTLVLLFWERLPNLVPLFYSLPWGEEQLSRPSFLFLLPVSSLAVLFLNLILTKILRSSGLLPSFAAWTAATFAFLALFTLLQIVLLVA